MHAKVVGSLKIRVQAEWCVEPGFHGHVNRPAASSGHPRGAQQNAGPEGRGPRLGVQHSSFHRLWALGDVPGARPLTSAAPGSRGGNRGCRARWSPPRYAGLPRAPAGAAQVPKHPEAAGDGTG